MQTVKHITVAGVSYPVRYDVNALCEFEELTGMSLLQRPRLDMRSMRALVFVGLKSGHQFEEKEFDKTLEDVGNMLGPKGFTDGTISSFILVLNESLGVKPKEQKKKGTSPAGE